MQNKNSPKIGLKINYKSIKSPSKMVDLLKTTSESGSINNRIHRLKTNNRFSAGPGLEFFLRRSCTYPY